MGTLVFDKLQHGRFCNIPHSLLVLWFCFPDVTEGQNAYKCESLSSNKEDCSTCHYLNQSMGYECQWCQSTGCVDIDNAQCRQAETCGKPVVTKISPTDGPSEGGTVVTLEGFNFGVQSIVAVTIAGVPCNNVTFMDRKINCTTSNKSFDSTKKSGESG
ncbi:plexin A3 [Magallana gigas]|uniref:plexin A3 n=1 Tax=Magallana gigas TaxID=29159 RepID=UPI00333FE9D0